MEQRTRPAAEALGYWIARLLRRPSLLGAALLAAGGVIWATSGTSAGSPVAQPKVSFAASPDVSSALSFIDRVAPRFREGDCYVVIDKNIPLNSVDKVLGRAPNGDYLVINLSTYGKDSVVQHIAESAYRNDEQVFFMRFQKVTCP